MKRDFFKMGRKIVTGVNNYSIDRQLQPVIPHQAVTPAQMLELAKQGIPISSQTAPIEEGKTQISWEIPLDQRKHVDAAELWQQQQEIRDKVKRAHKRDRQAYGD